MVVGGPGLRNLSEVAKELSPLRAMSRNKYSMIIASKVLEQRTT